MELFTGDHRQISNSEHFPQHITPFPDSSDLLYAHPAPDLIVQSSNLPPQKLRPIRCYGRSSSKKRANQMFEPNGEVNDYLTAAVKGEVCEAASGGAGFGGCLVAADQRQSGSGMEDWNRNFEERVVEDESSSSSEDCDDSSVDIKEPGDRKRKRKSWKKLENFLEKMVMKVMEKQEHMHKQLIETIEKRETERTIREEAWKQQEMERMKRDEEVRAKETSRNLALISFLQNMLGHEIEVPQPLVIWSPKDEGDKFDIQTDTKSDPNNKRWPEAEVQSLITLRTAMDHKFNVLGSKGSIWEEISVGMYNLGYNRTAKKCKEKWENMNKYFKRSVGSGKDPENSKRCPYFHELNTLYRNGRVDLGNTSNDTSSCNETKKEIE